MVASASLAACTVSVDTGTSGSPGDAPATAGPPGPADLSGLPASCHMRDGTLPDPACTPGAADPAVTQANIGSTICVSGYTATVRPSTNYTNRLKVQQLAADSRYVDRDPSHYEEDHAISLELGGDPKDSRNLWPEPHPRSFATDTRENRLHADVCAGRETLTAAQAEIVKIKQTLG